jgi:hypothetical protein
MRGAVAALAVGIQRGMAVAAAASAPACTNWRRVGAASAAASCRRSMIGVRAKGSSSGGRLVRRR